ncbi:tautomerase family protein, partial [Neisseria sicca]|uniref:tautomerase family protein n=1 Tax=Neisseria sicca TaxID=490 RepID=UPI0011BCF8F4
GSGEQKGKLMHGVTELLGGVLNKNGHTRVVVIEEVDMDKWGMGGERIRVGGGKWKKSG